MLYLSGCLPKAPEMQTMLRTAECGLMMQPGIGYSAATVTGWQWAADNGCFNTKTFDHDKWVAWLTKMVDVPGCLFAVVPDVVGDHAATLERFHQFWHIPADLGYRVAFVAQDGCTVADVPWADVGAVFIGGTTAFKLGRNAEQIVRHARSIGVWSHMGRVNSRRRLAIAAEWGCDSVDGTYLAFGPDVNTPRLVGYLNHVNTNPSLFTEEIPIAWNV